MKNVRYTLVGFFGFLIVTVFNVSIGILVYSSIKEKETIVIALVVLLFVILSTVLCSFIDLFRRKIMIERPLSEIIYATQQITKGDFNIKLIPNHSYKDYDEFDIIKDDINNMALELANSAVMKTDFIANVSHEIKTPLAVIQNYAKALENPNLNIEERKSYLKSLQQACKKLNTLVLNILKLNKLENQSMVPDISRFNVSELLTVQILQFEELIDKKNISLEINIEEDLYIDSDPSYLEIAFNNFISNAIKFTDNGGTIYISLVKLNDKYIFTFKDTGCGMDSETGKHIFDKFYQGDTSHSKEGNGLGLALVKRIIDLLGGEINVVSELGVGTEFKMIVKGEKSE